MRILTLLFTCFFTSIEAQPLKVMTYNIRYDNPGDGVNQWSTRKNKVFTLLKKYDPDIIGVQEALHHQLTDISGNLKQYEFLGAGRDDGKQKGEYSAIFIKKDRFKILEQNTFWLSETPHVPGSKNWDAAITRVVTWAKLQDKKSKKVFLMINTHFDHIGKESRRNSAALLKDRAASIGKELPVIITGDFNFTRDKPPYEVMMDPSPIRLIDTAPAEAPGTACGFAVDSRPCSAIDYIFHTSQWKSENYHVIKDHDGTNYPSDHLPVMVNLFY
ncbi:MAG: endonuclease/exonuclease/phosphatase family protein [Cyclobacteriaceae bacterium]